MPVIDLLECLPSVAVMAAIGSPFITNLEKLTHSLLLRKRERSAHANQTKMTNNNQ